MVRRRLPAPPSSACPLSPQPSSLPGNHRVVSFDDILTGLAGPREAAALKKWVESSAAVEPPPAADNLVRREAAPACYETRVYDSSTGEDTDGEDGGAAAPTAKPAARVGAPPGQARRQRRPASNVNEYTRAAFVGHSDTMGMMARRRARNSHAEGDAERPAPGSAAADRAALPPGWAAYDLDLEGLRGTRIAGGRLLVSPEGAVADSLPTARALVKAEAGGVKESDVARAVEWVRQLGTTKKADLAPRVDDPTARLMVALQRRRVALMVVEERRVQCSGKGGRPRGKREVGRASPGAVGGDSQKRQKRDASETSVTEDLGVSME